jgi:hypothetical protein
MATDNWLDEAIACGYASWLKDIIREHLPEIKDIQDTPEGHAQAKEWDAKIKQLISDRGLTEPSQQKNPITAIRNAIKTIDPNHPALDDVKLSTEDWIKINNDTHDKVSERENKYLTNPQAIADKGLQLLSSPEWFDIVAGLAVLTGRRSTELLKTAEFVYKTPYSVTFTGALKRRGETQTLSFEIPTLAPALSIVEAIGKVRTKLDTSNLTDRQINKNYSDDVAKACDKHFSKLVPAREGKDNLYTHLFRSVYATIATHLYCPTWISDLEYRATIQGHYFILDEKSSKLRRNLASERHYYDYKISDGRGNVDGRLGIKLDEPDVSILEVFQKKESTSVEVPQSEAESISLPVPATDKRKVSKYNFYVDERDRLDAVFSKLGLQGNQQNKFSGLLEWVEQKLNEPTDVTELSTEVAEQSTEVTEQVTEPHPDIANEVVTDQIDSESLPPNIPAFESAWLKIDKLADVLTNLATVLVDDRSRPGRATKSKEVVDKPVVENTQQKPVESIQQTRIESKPKPASGEGEAKVNEAIDAIMAYNNQPDRPYKDKWKIAISALKRLTRRNQDLIQRVMQERLEEIEAHHKQHDLSENQNTKGRNALKIDEAIVLN